MKTYGRDKRKRSTRAAARTFVSARLGWLRGFPATDEDGQLVWWSLGRRNAASPQPQAVTREMLRRAVYGRNAARRRFPVALADVVGDIDAWTARTDTQFDVLKGAVHDGAAMPGLEALLELAGARRSLCDAVETVAEQDGRLVPVLGALVWSHWYDEPEALNKSLAGLRMYRAPLVEVLHRARPGEGIYAVLLCLRLLRHKHGGRFVELVGDARCWQVPLSDGDVVKAMVSALDRRRKGETLDRNNLAEGFARPQPRLGSDLLEHLTLLSAMDTKACGQQLRLIDALLASEPLEAWAKWWHQIDDLERDVKRLLGTLPEKLRGDDAQKFVDMAAMVKLMPAPPAAVRWRTMRDRLAVINERVPTNVIDALATCCESASGAHDGRRLSGNLIDAWKYEIERAEAGWSVIEQLLKAQRRVLAALPCLGEEWQTWITQDLPQELSHTWIYRTRPRALLQPTMDALVMLIEQSELSSSSSGPFKDYTGWDCLVAAVEYTGNPERSAALIKAVPPAVENGLCGEAWTGLMRIAEGEADRFRAVAGGWRRAHWNEAVEKELVELSKAAETAQLLGDALAAGEGKRVSCIVAQSKLCRSLNVTVALPEPTFDAAAIEISDYPVGLHDDLRELARWDEKAASAADQILGRDFPLRANIERELVALHEKLAAAEGTARQSFEARIVGLQRRLKTTPAVTDRRLANLRKKLANRIRYAKLKRWEERLRAEFRSGLSKVQHEPVPQELFDDVDTVQLLTAVMGLDKRFAKLALQLLRVRSGPGPWDLREEPRNTAFLAALRRRGVDINPWLNGIGTRRVLIEGEPFALNLEDDPLEVMRMGEPFDTCLAPGAFNFFSAISNTADINKRVVYARDNKDTVQSRCLLALTDAGDILTFNVYAHKAHNEYQDAVKSYAQELALAMGVSLVARGEISKLVAHDWYDDGPVDLTGQLHFLSSDAPFTKALLTMSTGEVVAAIERASGAPLTRFIACAVIQSKAAHKRPELAVPLFEFIGDPELLDVWTRVNIGSVARRARQNELSRQLLLPMIRVLSRDTFHHYSAQVLLAEELVAMGLPHLTLRLLRQTRSKWVRDWLDDDRERVRIAAQALEALHRPYRALELYRIAASDGCRVAKSAVDRLEAELE